MPCFGVQHPNSSPIADVPTNDPNIGQGDIGYLTNDSGCGSGDGTGLDATTLNPQLEALNAVLEAAGTKDDSALATGADFLSALNTIILQNLISAGASIAADCGTGPIPATGVYLELNAAGDAVVDLYLDGNVIAPGSGLVVTCPDGTVWTFDGVNWVTDVAVETTVLRPYAPCVQDVFHDSSYTLTIGPNPSTIDYHNATVTGTQVNGNGDTLVDMEIVIPAGVTHFNSVLLHPVNQGTLAVQTVLPGTGPWGIFDGGDDVQLIAPTPPYSGPVDVGAMLLEGTVVEQSTQAGDPTLYPFTQRYSAGRKWMNVADEYRIGFDNLSGDPNDQPILLDRFGYLLAS